MCDLIMMFCLISLPATNCTNGLRNLKTETRRILLKRRQQTNSHHNHKQNTKQSAYQATQLLVGREKKLNYTSYHDVWRKNLRGGHGYHQKNKERKRIFPPQCTLRYHIFMVVITPLFPPVWVYLISLTGNNYYVAALQYLNNNAKSLP